MKEKCDAKGKCSKEKVCNTNTGWCVDKKGRKGKEILSTSLSLLPPLRAKEFAGKRKKGNDGKMWESKADKRGVYRWHRVKSPIKKVTSKKSSSPIVVCVKVGSIRPKHNNLKEWMQDPNNVYIGRKGVVFINGERFPKKDSIYSNPFKINKDGTREAVIEKYKKYIINKVSKDDILKLKGKVLGCWCKPEPCHGDILVDLYNKYSKR